MCRTQSHYSPMVLLEPFVRLSSPYYRYKLRVGKDPLWTKPRGWTPSCMIDLLGGLGLIDFDAMARADVGNHGHNIRH